MIKTVLQIRYHLLWTAARAAQCGLSYITSAGTRTDGNCPLCPGASPPRDTAGHILGFCALPPFPAMRIARHNAALLHVQACIHQGSLGGCFTIMDATSRSCLPVGVSSTRLPLWMLPRYAGDRDLFRPDILLIAGLPTTLAPSAPMCASALAALQTHCVVHIVELTYTHDSAYSSTLLRKHAQHVLLVQALTNAGWTVHAPVHVILLGTYGTIFSLISPVLRHLGVINHVVPSLLQRLHIHAVTTAHAMLTLRRRLERTPAFRSSPDLPLPIHDYPP